MSGSPNIAAFKKASKAPKKRKGPPPVSVRLTEQEYERLRYDAGVMSMAAYIRLKVFEQEETAPHRKPYTRKKMTPSSELTMIGHMLGGLGESETASNLNHIAKAVQIGALPVSPELSDKIEDACEAVQDIRLMLVSALGVKAR